MNVIEQENIRFRVSAQSLGQHSTTRPLSWSYISTHFTIYYLLPIAEPLIQFSQGSLGLNLMYLLSITMSQFIYLFLVRK